MEHMAFAREMELKLKDLEAHVESLRARAASLDADKKRDFYEHLTHIHSLREEAQRRLQELRKLADEADEGARSSVEQGYQSLWDYVENRVSPYFYH